MSCTNNFWFDLQDVKDILEEYTIKHSPIRIHSFSFEQNGLLLTLNRPSVAKSLFEEISGTEASYGNTQVFTDKVRIYFIIKYVLYKHSRLLPLWLNDDRRVIRSNSNLAVAG